MKKVLAVILCVCIALTLSVAVMAGSSAENKITIRKGTGSKQDGTSIPQDTSVEIGENKTVTIQANEKVYGTFNNWTIYVAKPNPTTGKTEYVEAVEGVDYTIVSGSLEDSTIVIKPINQITVAGNYNNKKTDPSKASSSGSSSSSSPHTGDVEVLYVAFALFAAGAVVFGAKRQLSK